MTIIKRADLGRPLTWDELDDNFDQVDSLVSTAATAVQTATTQAQAASGFADTASNASQEAQDAAATAGSAASAAVAGIYSDFASTDAGKGASLVKLTTSRTVEDKLIAYPDALDQGASGNGVTDDYLKYSLAEVNNNPLYLPQNKNFNIGSHINQSKVWGPGSITISSVKFDKMSFRYDLKSDSLFLNPPSYYSIFGDYPGSTGKSNILISPGTNGEGKTNRTTVLGTNNFTKVISVDRSEAIGNSAFQFMRYGERNTALGSIVGQWLGTNDPAGDGHEMWANAGGYTPGQPGWDYGGFETANPGIGAKIAAFNTFATQPSECSRNVGVGRNAFNGGVTLNNCTAIGYRAGASFFGVSNSSAFGTDAFRSGLFLNNSVALGYASGTNWQEGERNTVLGVQAGVNVVKGDGNTLVGSFAGSDAKQITDCLFLGAGAGNDIIAVNPTPSNLLAIGNDVTGVGSPLICGDMASPKVGINTLPSKIAGTFHIRSGDAAVSVVAPNTSADDLIVESTGNSGITIRSGATNLGSLIFSSPTSNNPGGILYNHSVSDVTFRVNAADRWKITSSSINPAADNVYSVGTAALRPSVIYAGAGTINTSDETQKTSIRDISEIEKKVALAIKKDIKAFKFKDAVIEKGEEAARWHFGVMAQRVGDIFIQEGLDPNDYGLFCYDKWNEISEERDEFDNVTVARVEAGERYGIRYDELAMFIIAAI